MSMSESKEVTKKTSKMSFKANAFSIEALMGDAKNVHEISAESTDNTENEEGNFALVLVS